MLKNGFIKIYRSMLTWEWYKNSNTKSLFLHCLLKANYTEAKFENEVIKRGEFVTSFKKLSEETGMTVNEIRTALKHLILTKVLTSRSSSKYTVITVLNFDKYQEVTNDFTNKSQTINKRLTNESQQYKKNKKNKNDKKRECELTLGSNKNVFLTEIELSELKRSYPAQAERKIQRLSTYLAATGRRYNNHFAVLQDWCKADAEKDAEKVKTESKPSYNLDDFELQTMRNTPRVTKDEA